MNIRPISPLYTYANYQVPFSSKKRYSDRAKEEHYREIGETTRERFVRKFYEFLGLQPPLSKSEKKYIAAKEKEYQQRKKAKQNDSLKADSYVSSGKRQLDVKEAPAAAVSSSQKRKPEKAPDVSIEHRIPKSQKTDYDLSDFMARLRESLNNENAKFGDIVEILDSKITKLPETDSRKKAYQDIREEAKRSNTSFMPTVVITDKDLEDNDVIIKKVNRLINQAPENEATVFDVLDWFDNNGEKIKDCNFSVYKNCTVSLIDEISSTVDLFAEFNPMSDDVLKKYVKLYKKFAKPAENNDILKRSNDASNLVNIFNKYSESMNKDTAYAFFDELKRTSMNYRHFHDVKFSAGLISDMTDGEKEDFACEIETQEAKLYDRYKRLKRNKNM